MTSASLVNFSNSLMSAPTMKPRCLPEMMTRPLMVPARPARSASSMMAPSSSSGRRPSAFALAPSRSNVAQAMPSRSTVVAPVLQRSGIESHRREPSQCNVGGLLGGGGFNGGARVVTGLHVMGPQFGRIEVIDGDDAGDERFDLAQEGGFAFADDVLGNRIADPVDAVDSGAACRRGWRSRVSSRPLPRRRLSPASLRARPSGRLHPWRCRCGA